MNFALNYSHPAASLVREGRIDIDLFKCPNWDDAIAEARQTRPVYVHFALGAGDPAARQPDLDRVEKLARETNTPFINVHICPKVRDYPGLSDGGSPAEVARVRERTIEDVNGLVNRFGADRVMVEMVPYGNPAEGFFRAATEPAFIRDVCDATGCGLLLDLSHSRITAHVLGEDAKAFVERMPLDRLRELHITGLGYIGPILKDHLPMTDTDWPMMEWALERIRIGAWARPWCVACEYGGVGELSAMMTDPKVIEDQVPRMRDMVHSID